VFVYDEVEFVSSAKLGGAALIDGDPELAAVVAEEPKQVASIHYRSHFRLTLAHLYSAKTASKAALLTFPNRSEFSSYQDWRVIITCYLIVVLCNYNGD
jgi:hypothetical protein